MKGWPGILGFVLALLASAFLRAGDSWTSGPVVAQIRVHCSPSNLDKLRAAPREWVSCTVEVDDRTKVQSRVRVKGAIGSFQPIDQGPSLTLDSMGGDVFRGVPRIHLDNCAQDPGHLDAAFGAAAFLRIGIMSPRVQWAMVRLNDRDLGWYVLKEGFTAGYAVRAFGDVEVVLGEPMSGGDVGGPFEFKAGGGEASRDRARELWSQLGALCRLADPEARWRDLDRHVDRRGFLDFAAMEVVLAHRDGYSLARNNYRLVFARDRVHWMPWGMDQLLVSDGYTLEPEFSGELLRSIQRAGGFGAAWQDAVRRASVVALDREWCEAWIREVQDQVEQALPFRHRAQLTEGVAVLRRRLDGRRGFVTRTLSAWAEPPGAWREGVFKPQTWMAVDVPANGRAESVTNLAGLGGPALGLTAGPVTSSSWRATVRLEPGSYRFSGRVSTVGVEGLSFGSHHGVALRVLGEEGRSMELVGGNNWRELSVDFRVADQARVLSLICELRGRAGQVWFDRGSLQLLRLK